MEQQATWILSKTGKEIGGCCVQASPRDYARMGLFILNGANVSMAKASCLTRWPQATTKRADIWFPAGAWVWLSVVDL